VPADHLFPDAQTGMPEVVNAADLAAKAGNFDCLEVALAYGYLTDDPEVLKAAIAGGHFSCVKLLCEKCSPPITEEILAFAIKHAQVACVEYLAPLLEKSSDTKMAEDMAKRMDLVESGNAAQQWAEVVRTDVTDGGSNLQRLEKFVAPPFSAHAQQGGPGVRDDVVRGLKPRYRPRMSLFSVAAAMKRVGPGGLSRGRVSSRAREGVVGVCDQMARGGEVAALQTLVEAGCVKYMDADTLTAAATGGSTECMRYVNAFPAFTRVSGHTCLHGSEHASHCLCVRGTPCRRRCGCHCKKMGTRSCGSRTHGWIPSSPWAVSCGYLTWEVVSACTEDFSRF
jgi:hypothetical protein